MHLLEGLGFTKNTRSIISHTAQTPSPTTSAESVDTFAQICTPIPQESVESEENSVTADPATVDPVTADPVAVDSAPIVTDPPKVL